MKKKLSFLLGIVLCLTLLFGFYHIEINLYAILVLTGLSAAEDFKEKQVSVWKTTSILLFGIALAVHFFVMTGLVGYLIGILVLLAICLATNVFGLWGSADGKVLFGNLVPIFTLLSPSFLSYLMGTAVYLLCSCVFVLLIQTFSKIKEKDKPLLQQTAAVVPGFFVTSLSFWILYGTYIYSGGTFL